jgi:hypothetical protein
VFSGFDGGRTRARTLDPLVKSQLRKMISDIPLHRFSISATDKNAQVVALIVQMWTNHLSVLAAPRAALPPTAPKRPYPAVSGRAAFGIRNVEADIRAGKAQWQLTILGAGSRSLPSTSGVRQDTTFTGLHGAPVRYPCTPLPLYRESRGLCVVVSRRGAGPYGSLVPRLAH